jgi:hypothetical protein
MTHQYDFTIEATTEKEAEQKINALTMLASKLKTNELVKLALVVEKDPVTTRLAKKFLKLN